jgi:hypothetical protein
VNGLAVVKGLQELMTASSSDVLLNPKVSLIRLSVVDAINHYTPKERKLTHVTAARRHSVAWMHLM